MTTKIDLNALVREHYGADDRFVEIVRWVASMRPSTEMHALQLI